MEDDGVVNAAVCDIEYFLTDTFKQSWRDRTPTTTSSEKWRQKQRAYMPTLPDVRDMVAEFMSNVL